MVRLAGLALLVFLLNLPFGYWRAGVRRFSAPWIFAIHSPVPAVVALRLGLGIGWAWPTFPPLVGAFFLGQFCGGSLKKKLATGGRAVSSCLAMDLIRFGTHRGRLERSTGTRPGAGADNPRG